MKYTLTLHWILRSLIALLFIFSAITKLYPIASFEKQLVDLGIANWCFAPTLARSIISLEFFLGFAFLQNHFFKKFIIPITISLLVGFCIHLSFQIVQTGNTGNCGCMGQAIPMTPLQAIIKNIISIAIITLIYLKTPHKGDSKHRYPLAILVLVTLPVFIYFKSNCCCDTPAALPKHPLHLTPVVSMLDSSALNLPKDSTEAVKSPKPLVGDQKQIPSKTNTQTEKSVAPPHKVSEFAPYTLFSDGKEVSLDIGKKIVCVFNTNCDHCMETAKEITEVRKKSPIPSVYVLFWSENDATGVALQSEINKFFTYAGAEYPYTVIETGTFFRLLGKAPSPPRVAVLHHGNIIGDFSTLNFSKDTLIKVSK